MIGSGSAHFDRTGNFGSLIAPDLPEVVEVEEEECIWATGSTDDDGELGMPLKCQERGCSGKWNGCGEFCREWISKN